MDTTNRETEASRTLERLNSQADALRAELANLREALAQVERDFKSSPGTLLREANEQLVLAALRSQAIADKAKSSLEQLPRQEPGPVSGPEGAAGLMRSLREVNERLVISALASQEHEEEAKAALHRQVAFLATVAHELRSPLFPLRMAADLLNRVGNDEALRSKLQGTITSQVVHISRLIGDLLDGARVSTGKFSLERTSVDLTRVLHLAIDTCLPNVDARHHQFTYRLPEQPLKVNGDPVRLVQVFSNLIDNACKYTPQGGRISLEATQQGDTAQITVSDNGVGISPAALAHVFELFVRDHRAVAVDQAGLGIGLAVVRELVEAHGGTVEAYSAGKDSGSRFTVTLPLETAA